MLSRVKTIIVVILLVITVITCCNPLYPEEQFLQHIGTVLLFIPMVLDIKLPITMTLYLGNVIPLGIYLFTSYCISPPSVEAWYLLFLIGWIFLSIIPVAVSICIVNKKLNAYRTN